MIEGTLALIVALGLLFSIVGGFKLMRATPIFGADSDGYLAQDGGGPLQSLVAKQRWGWRLLVLGFALQFASALVAACIAFSRALGRPY